MSSHGECCKGTFGVICLNCNERVDVEELVGPAREQMEAAIAEKTALKIKIAELEGQLQALKQQLR